MAALGNDKEAYREIWAALRRGDRVGVEKVLKGAARKAVRDCRRYIDQNWEGIMAYKLYPEAQLGVSAEAHVSHILAARLDLRGRWPGVLAG